MDFRILGPLEVERDGEELDLGPHKQRSLLALLLVNANRVVSVDRILDELWGDQSEGKEKTLWVYVSRLRAILEPDRAQPTVLQTRDHGYALSVDPESVDAERFENLVAEGRSLLPGDRTTASKAFVEGLALCSRLFVCQPLDREAFVSSEPIPVTAR